MKTPDKPPEKSPGKDGAKESPVSKFKRAATIVMTTNRNDVKAREALEARQKLKAKKKD